MHYLLIILYLLSILPGVKIIFRVGLVLLKCMLGTREKVKSCQGQYETMELLRAIEPRYMQEGFLVREVHITHTHTHTQNLPINFGNIGPPYEIIISFSHLRGNLFLK